MPTRSSETNRLSILLLLAVSVSRAAHDFNLISIGFSFLEQFPKSILVSNAAPKKDWNPGSCQLNRYRWLAGKAGILPFIDR